MDDARAAHRHAILLVDDYLDLREALAVLLEFDGCQVVTASSGPEALAILKAGYRPCVVLLDYVMPEMDGWEVRTRMLDDPELAKVAVVMMSGDSSLIHARDEGTVGVLAKPARPEDLRAAIAQFALCQRT
jgi:two-component system, chemotaxis family, chemotaxis protein CheY